MSLSIGVFSSQMIRAGADKQPWLEQSHLTQKRMPILPIPIKNKSHWVPVWKGNNDLSLSLLTLCLLNMKLQPEYSQFNLAERASITAS